jgi:uncharacterized protein YciI
MSYPLDILRNMRVDASHTDALAVCHRPHCVWRSGPYVDKTGARAALRKHTETVHNIEAAHAIAKARQRDRESTPRP